MPDTADLLALSRNRTWDRQTCWRRKLPDEAIEYIEAVEDDIAAHNYQGIAFVLTDHFGFQIGYKSVSNHYAGRCGCPRQTTS